MKSNPNVSIPNTPTHKHETMSKSNAPITFYASLPPSPCPPPSLFWLRPRRKPKSLLKKAASMACGGLNPLFAPHMDPAAGLRGALGYPAAFGLGPFGSHPLHPHSVFGGFGGASGFGGVPPTSAVGNPGAHSASLAAAGKY